MYNSVFKPGLFADRVVVVTGGGSGIGRCVAHELASLGGQVVLVGRQKDRLERVVGEIAALQGRGAAIQCDIREEDQVKSMVSEALDVHGRIDGLVNSAGGQFPSLLSGMSRRAWEAVIKNNLTGTFLVCREVVTQVFGRSGGGAIVNVIADYRNGMPGLGHTGAARAGVDNLTKTGALEWAHLGVRVNSVAPGLIASSGLETYDEKFRQVLSRAIARAPAGRPGTTSEVSAAIVFLLSPAARYINGAFMSVDGGFSLVGAHFFEFMEHEPHPQYDGFGS